MSHTIEYLPVAVATGANVDSQADFQGSSYQQIGFSVGIAQPDQVNKILRQSSMVSAVIANFTSNILGIDILDDGNLGGLLANFTNAILAAALLSQNRVVSVPFSATPIFDASQGNVFEIVLTGNVTSSTLVNLTPGQSLFFLVTQDSTGGRSFVPPNNLPMATLPNGANQTGLQTFIVGAGNTVFADGPVTVQP